jgi:diguanylate cyclase (GGDEF)-like protein
VDDAIELGECLLQHQQAEERMRSVVELARALATAKEPMAAIRAAAEQARNALAGSMAAISRWEGENGTLRVLVNSGARASGEEELPEDESYPLADFPEAARLLRERWAEGATPHAWVETAEGEHEAGRGTVLRRRGRSSCVVAPILLQGRAWGELSVSRDLGRPHFDRCDAEFATVLASLIAPGIAQTERLEQVRRLAFTDPLTGLANRRAVDTRLAEVVERHLETGAVASLAVCDINGLKRVNDELGHEFGDELLVAFAGVLGRCAAMLPGSLAARLGGDEFCLVVGGHGADEVLRVAEEVCRRARSLPYGEGVACGVASTGDAIGAVTTPAGLFRLADAAQYHAKAERSPVPVAAGRGEAAVHPPVPHGERRTFRGATDI